MLANVTCGRDFAGCVTPAVYVRKERKWRKERVLTLRSIACGAAFGTRRCCVLLKLLD